MKKISLFVIAVFTLCISCEEDDDTTFVQENYVLGKWSLNQIGFITPQNTILYEDYVNNTECEDDNLVFNENNTFEENDFELVNSACQNLQTTGSFDVDNNKINLLYTENGETFTQTLTIVSLTFVDIILSYTDTETNQLVFLKLNKNN